MKMLVCGKMGRRLSRFIWSHRIGAFACFMLGLILLMGSAGFRVNFTPSEPLGLWRIVKLDRPLVIGDHVFICPPLSEETRQARARGYLRFGLCAGHVAPLIKAVAATSGHVIEICGNVRVDGSPLPHSPVAIMDGKGRAMVPYEGGVVAPGTIYLHSAFPASFDSRYFGPLPVDGILGFAQEVWTYAP
jgi:conjugative transfer signal peptidase TraF